MDPISLMVASIGMQFFNNYTNNSKSKEIQARQREFQKAAAVHDFDRMRKAQTAAAKLALELEADVHKERLEDIEKSYDSLLEKFANDFAISNWPLNVLPFIMKGESFGSLFGGTSKSICMHCILTPSNCQWFNEFIYDDLDLRIEAEINNNWNAQSTHPVVYYGGGWNRRQNKPNGTSIPSSIDLVDIELLKTQLKQIPTMVITPYFEPYLYFKVQLWGMGKDSEKPFKIFVPHGDLEPSTRIFSYDYNKEEVPQLTDDLFNSTMDEFVSYLEKLIGFVADKYFWDIYKVSPIYPIIAKRQNLLFFNEHDKRNHYLNLLECVDKKTISAHGTNKLINILKQSINTNDEKYSHDLIVKLLCQLCNSQTEEKLCNADNLDEFLTYVYFGIADIPFLKELLSIINTFHYEESIVLYKKLSTLIQKIVYFNDNYIANFFPYITLRDFLEYINNNIIGQLRSEDLIVLDLFPDERIATVSLLEKEHDYHISSLPLQKFNYRIDGFLVPLELKRKRPKRLRIKKENIHSFMDKISLDCNVNLFHMVISLEIIVKYCKELKDNIKFCSLSIKNSIPMEIIKKIDRNLLNNLIFCEIESWNNEHIQQLFYFDDMEGELKEKFLVTNNLIIH